MNLICIGLVNHLRLNELKLIENDGWSFGVCLEGNTFYSLPCNTSINWPCPNPWALQKKRRDVNTLSHQYEWRVKVARDANCSHFTKLFRLLQVQFMAWNRFYSQLASAPLFFLWNSKNSTKTRLHEPALVQIFNRRRKQSSEWNTSDRETNWMPAAGTSHNPLR